MKITKLGHCCLLIEDNGTRILTDPGAWTTRQNEIIDLDLILITHEHPDHFHLDSLKIVMENNPAAQIITNKSVAALLEGKEYSVVIVEDGQSQRIKTALIQGFGEEHAPIYLSYGQVKNTGYLINDVFFYPGDALTHPKKPIKILALPVVGPWLKLADAISYALEIKPEICFPVHDGMLQITGPFHRLPQTVLQQQGIDFVLPRENQDIIIEL